jgi:uncharacterized RDD family membrane protein YckC
VIEPGPPAAPGTAHALAAIWRRAVARVTDGLIFAVPAFLLLVPYLDTDDGELTLDPPLWLLGTITLASLIYEVVLVAVRGQTLGKIAMGIEVARIDTGRPPSWSHSGIRALVPTVAGAVPVVGVFLWLGTYLLAVVTPRRQGLHDLAAGTIVVASR